MSPPDADRRAILRRRALLIAAFSGLTGHAGAQSSPEPVACGPTQRPLDEQLAVFRELVMQGSARLGQGDATGALDHFERAAQIWQHAKLYRLMATARASLGQTAAALHNLARMERCLDAAREPHPPELAAERETLEAGTAEVTFHADASGPLRMDGVEVGELPRPEALRVEPGVHDFSFSFRGNTVHHQLAVLAGERYEIEPKPEVEPQVCLGVPHPCLQPPPREPCEEYDCLDRELSVGLRGGALFGLTEGESTKGGGQLGVQLDFDLSQKFVLAPGLSGGFYAGGDAVVFAGGELGLFLNLDRNHRRALQTGLAAGAGYLWHAGDPKTAFTPVNSPYVSAALYPVRVQGGSLNYDVGAALYLSRQERADGDSRLGASFIGVSLRLEFSVATWHSTDQPAMARR